MTYVEDIPETAALDLARECLYRFLSALATDPYTASGGWERLADPQTQALAIAAADLLRDWADQNPTPLTFGELPPKALDLRPLIAALPGTVADLRDDHDRVFGLIAPKECPPYETEYHPPGQTFLRSQQTADVAGFYRAFGIEPGGDTRERPDHIALELEFLALLLTKKRMAPEGASAEPAAICDQAFHDFVKDHLAWWIPAFAAGLRRKAGHGPYHALADVLAALIPTERSRLQIAAPFRLVQPALVEPPEEQSGCAGCS